MAIRFGDTITSKNIVVTDSLSATGTGTKINTDFGSQLVYSDFGGRLGRPSNFWGGTYYDVDGHGSIHSRGSFEVSITCNGYRSGTPSTNTTWTGLSGANNTAFGASQISLNPTGQIFFATDANKPTGSTNDPTERMRINNSGQVLIGGAAATSPGFDATFYVESGIGAMVGMGSVVASSSTTIAVGRRRTGLATVVNGDSLGKFSAFGWNGTEYIEASRIETVVDAAPGVDDMPGRLVFSTTADGDSAPTERMRINSAGIVMGGKTSPGLAFEGWELYPSGTIYATRSNNTAVFINRTDGDGRFISFQRDNVEQGWISVASGLVTLTGAHLSRLSQLSGTPRRENIPTGTVLSNLDNLCVWNNEINLQLNCTKVSDIEGDPNIAGVFDVWDNEDENYVNDFTVAMTGDFIIRIGQNTTVQRGDLLMSAGDGTAKPQGDDTIRSKTIAKVTSTQKVVTYEDGSYCVPCVLMAC